MLVLDGHEQVFDVAAPSSPALLPREARGRREEEGFNRHVRCYKEPDADTSRELEFPVLDTDGAVGKPSPAKHKSAVSARGR